MAAGDGQLLEAEAVDAGVVERVSARRALELGSGEGESGSLGCPERAFEPCGPATIVDRGAEALELVGRRAMQAGGDEQAVEGQLDVIAARSAVADRDAELLLDRRTHVEAGVVVGAEEMGGTEVGEPAREVACRVEQVTVVTVPIGLEPVAVVVGLEIPQEL